MTKYTLHGKNVVHMTQGSNELHFFYDAQNKPTVVVYNGTAYSYVKNLQGDIIAILDSNKNVVVSYVYDAWGRPISKNGSMAATLGTVQPFRYRSYVYDEETNLYYLRSRYYCIMHMQFVNPDSVFVLDAWYPTNQYAYCNNNPVLNIDNDGYAADYGLRTRIHNAVCAAVAQALSGQTGFGMKVVISARNLGFMDVVHNGNLVAEIKRVTCNPVWAVYQLNKYLNGTWVGSISRPARYSKVERSKTTISNYIVVEGYVVVYCGLGNGFVVYDYYEGEVDDDRIQHLKKALLASAFSNVATMSTPSSSDERLRKSITHAFVTFGCAAGVFVISMLMNESGTERK